PEAVSVELRSISAVIHLADMIACQERMGFYLTAQNESINPELLELLHISEEQVNEVRAALPEQLADAEATLAA
ncbi:MAG: hypothetical protein Q7R41_20235, partial [Phycisphaerales bacterium]|nr:hypothetical protein [Phycisphaerales bacterium]